MKRLWVFITACLLLFSSATAETVTTQEFTADEQAYNVYLDISTGYAEGVKYLEEIEYLWRQAIELGDVEKADSVWFNAMIAAGGGELDITHMMRYQQLAQLKYGYADYTGLYNHFAALLKLQTSKEMSSIVRAALPLSIEAGYIQSAEKLEVYLDDAKAGIRMLMKLDPDYSFTEDLQNYYKELNLLLKYIQDFNATYTDFKAKTENFAEKLISYEVDFEFIFDPDDYEKVIEVRSDKREAENQAIYEQAQALENIGKYEDAIELYWQSGNHDEIKRVKQSIAEAELEDRYQEACAMEACGNKAGAFSAFKELGIYKDSNDRATNLAGFAKIAYAEHNTYSTEENENIRGNIQRSHTINYFYDTNGVLLSTKTTEQYPTEITYLYENGRLISSVDRGALSITDGKISQYRRLESTYNANGDPITLAYVIEIVATKQEARSEGTIQYSYNEYGDKINREGFEINTFGNATYSYNYVYENGIKQEVSCVRNGEPYTKTYYEYDSYGCLEKELTVWYHYDGKTHYTELIYTY